MRNDPIIGTEINPPFADDVLDGVEMGNHSRLRGRSVSLFQSANRADRSYV